MVGAVAAPGHVLAEVQHQRARVVRPESLDPERTVTLIHLQLRVVVAIAVSDLEHRDFRPHGLQEGQRGRRAAAVVRRQQDVRAQAIRSALDQRRFLRRFDVAGQQHRAPAVADTERAAAGIRLQVRVIVAGRRRMQHVERDAVPFPMLAGAAAHVARRRADDGVIGGQRRGEPAGADAFQHRQRAARVVGVAMADDDPVERGDAAHPQVRQDHAAAAVRSRGVRGARVVQQAVPLRFDEQRHALPHVERGYAKGVAAGMVRELQQHRQQRDGPGPAVRPAARHQQPQDAAESEREHPRLRCRRAPHGAGPAGHQPQQPGEHLHRPVREQEQPVARRPGHQAAGQRERRHDETDERNRHRIRNRAHDRHLAEQQQRQRHQPGRDGPLRPAGQQQRAARTRGRRPDAAMTREQDDGHGPERQPEPRPQHGPRIEQHDDRERRAQHVRHGRETPHPQCERDDGQHVQGALCRHAEAGQQHVQEGDGGAGQRGGLLCRQPQRQARIGEERAAPQRRHGPRGESRDHRDVQARDRNEVADTGAIEHLPVGLLLVYTIVLPSNT